MTSKLMLQMCQRALNEIVNQRGLTGRAEWPAPFNGVFTSYTLAAELDRHLKELEGFSVTLGYPSEMCEHDGETYASDSSEATWEAAVKDVARQMQEDNEGMSRESVLTIVDVEALGENTTFPGVDRNAVVRFRRSGPVIMSRHDSDTEDRYVEALENAQRSMEQLPGLEPKSALKQAAHDLGIPYGDAMGAFVDWAEAELYGEEAADA